MVGEAPPPPRSLRPVADQGFDLRQPVGGRLMGFVARWQQITEDRFVLQTIAEGYRIEFTGPYALSDTPLFGRPPRTEEQRQALQEEIDNMLKKRAIIQLSEKDIRTPGYYSTVFMRPKPSGAWRPILNLKRLNKSIRPQKFRMDTLQVVVEELEIGEYVTSIDLEDAYFHVAIHPKDRKFLRFAIGGKVFQFQVLPFGLSTAPRVFTRVVKALVAYLRKRGLKMFSYLDDWLQSNRDRLRLREQTQLALTETEEAGFLVNRTKSDLEPTQFPVYLGAQLNMLLGLIRPSDQRLDTLELFVLDLLSEGSAPAIFWLQMLGRMASCKGLVPFSMLNMRLIQLCFQSQWNKSIPMSREVTFPESLIPNLRWWLDRDNTQRGVPFHLPEPTVYLSTDSSDTEWGGHIDDLEISGVWEKEILSQHINMKELRAVLRCLRHFHRLVRGRSVLIQSDSATAVAYINRQGGTRSPSLCLLTLDLYRWCSTNNVRMKAIHVPGKQNLQADYLSRGKVVPTEWALHRGVVKMVFNTLGRPHVDLFASAINAVLPTFCTRFPHPTAWATNAFSLSWRGMHAYAYPPISLIRKVLAKLEEEPCRLLLIAPLWPRQHWFQRLLALLVAPPRLLPEREDLLFQGREQFPQPENLHLTAWLLSSNPSEKRDFLNGLPRWQQRPDERVRLGCTIPDFVIGQNGAKKEVMIPILCL